METCLLSGSFSLQETLEFYGKQYPEKCFVTKKIIDGVMKNNQRGSALPGAAARAVGRPLSVWSSTWLSLAVFCPTSSSKNA